MLGINGLKLCEVVPARNQQPLALVGVFYIPPRAVRSTTSMVHQYFVEDFIDNRLLTLELFASGVGHGHRMFGWTTNLLFGWRRRFGRRINYADLWFRWIVPSDQSWRSDGSLLLLALRLHSDLAW